MNIAELAPGRIARMVRYWPRLLKRAAAVIGGGLLLSGCHGVMTPQGPIAAADWKIFLDSLVIMLAIGIPTIIATYWFAWWFRADNQRARYMPEFVYSGELELIVWAIPILVIMFLGGIIWIGSHELDPATPIKSTSEPLNVEVISLDWKWLFIYPEQGIASVNRLVIPAKRPIHFHLTSASVMNTFFVPALGSMIYTMYGMATELYLEASHEGVYYGRSAQFSGDGFSGMQFAVNAVSEQAFDKWAAQARAKSGEDLDVQHYLALAMQSQNVKPFTYHAVVPGLFRAIATQSLPPAPGPKTGEPSASVRPR